MSFHPIYCRHFHLWSVLLVVEWVRELSSPKDVIIKASYTKSKYSRLTNVNCHVTFSEKYLLKRVIIVVISQSFIRFYLFWFIFYLIVMNCLFVRSSNQILYLSLFFCGNTEFFHHASCLFDFSLSAINCSFPLCILSSQSNTFHCHLKPQSQCEGEKLEQKKT